MKGILAALLFVPSVAMAGGGTSAVVGVQGDLTKVTIGDAGGGFGYGGAVSLGLPKEFTNKGPMWLGTGEVELGYHVLKYDTDFTVHPVTAMIGGRVAGAVWHSPAKHEGKKHKKGRRRTKGRARFEKIVDLGPVAHVGIEGDDFKFTDMRVAGEVGGFADYSTKSFTLSLQLTNTWLLTKSSTSNVNDPFGWAQFGVMISFPISGKNLGDLAGAAGGVGGGGGGGGGGNNRP